jgi:hypothetical protein
MPIRKVKQYSDRGKIKDLASKQESEAQPLPSELRLQRLYEYAKQHNDHGILNALGFITTDYVADKNALPLTVYRIRQVVADIKSRSSEPIDLFGQELSKFFGIEHTAESDAYWDKKRMVKSAAVKKPPVFRRVK